MAGPVSDDEQMERFRAAAEGCTSTVFWHPPRTPVEVLRARRRRRRGAGRSPTGTSTPSAGRSPRSSDRSPSCSASRPPRSSPAASWPSRPRSACGRDRTHSKRVAIPDLSHLLKHEDDGPRRLHGFEFEHLTTGRATATADDLRALGPGLGAALVEMPLRDAGCLLPTWEELGELSAAARELGVPLHADGARIWESQPFYDRPLAEIAEHFDSIYVSFYKGLEGLAGAALVGPSGRRRRGPPLAQADGRHPVPPDAVRGVGPVGAPRPAAPDGGVRRVGALARHRAGRRAGCDPRPSRRTPTPSWSTPRATPTRSSSG